MKNALLFSYLLAISTVFAGCTQESAGYGDTTREAITKTQWSVQYYFSSEDRTAEFSHYKISFNGNGVIRIDDGTTAIQGRWNMITGVNRNNILNLNISEAHFQALNDEWDVNVTADGSLYMKGTAREMRLAKL